MNLYIDILKIRIPDDRSSRSNFGMIDDELEEQVRDILEEEDTEEDDNDSTLRRARNMYKSCMDEEAIDAKGVAPLTTVLADMGGWPVVEGDAWDESSFNW